MCNTKTNRQRYGRTAPAADKALVTLMETLEPRQLLSTYYVSSTGSDTASKSLSTLNLKNVDISGYGREGMRIVVTGAGSSFNDVKVESANLHDNLYGGLKVTGSAHNANKNYLVNHVNAWNGPGSRLVGGVTGSGIYLADVDGARITRCVV